jgi:endo-1,4-beta-xylanase
VAVGALAAPPGRVVAAASCTASYPVISIKDPTVFRCKNRWHVYATTANTSGQRSLAHTSFANWPKAAAPQTFLDTNPNIGKRYAAAPQMFYFAPQKT